MILKVYSPLGVVLEQEIQKVDFQALDGYFTLLPKHVDFVSAMPPNIVRYTVDGKEKYMACNRGILVKKGDVVSLCAHKAVLSDTIDALSDTIRIEFKQDDEQRKEVNTVMARLEMGLARGFQRLKVEGQDGSI